MKSYDLYAQLELITPEVSPAPATRSVWAWTRTQATQAGRSLVRFLTGSQNPQVEIRYTRHGYPYYWVYDPVARSRHTFASEAEVRIWIEQRYYR